MSHLNFYLKNQNETNYKSFLYWKKLFAFQIISKFNYIIHCHLVYVETNIGVSFNILIYVLTWWGATDNRHYHWFERTLYKALAEPKACSIHFIEDRLRAIDLDLDHKYHKVEGIHTILPRIQIFPNSVYCHSDAKASGIKFTQE